MDKSLDEIIGGSKPAAGPKSGAPKGVSKRGPRRSKPAGRAPAPTQRSFKAVCIRNLADTISEDDLRDLFRQVGPVVRIHIERDQRGDRSGMAWVLYDFAEDARVAAERFNQRRAAGKTITVRRVAHVGDTGAGLASLGDRIGERVGNSKTKPRKKRSERGKAEKAERAPPKSRNAADLDAELDAYMQVESGVPSQAPSESKSQTPAPPAPPAEESMIDV